MKEKTYLRMTRRSPLRGLKLFKHKYLTKQRFYALLAHLKLVREVKREANIPHYSYNDGIFNNVLTDQPIVTERGKFNVSHYASMRVITHHHWYESLRKHNRLYTVRDESYYEIRVNVQAECESFLVKINPFTSAVVHRRSPKVYVNDNPAPTLSPFTEGSEMSVGKFSVVTCDFLNARLKISMDNRVSDIDDASLAVKELLEITTGRLRDYIDGNSEAINEKLTGIKFDGEFHTKEGHRLLPNNLCAKCGFPVFETPVEGYTAQCVHCYEDLYSFEVEKVDPVYYKDVYEKCKSLLHHYLSE